MRIGREIRKLLGFDDLENIVMKAVIFVSM